MEKEENLYDEKDEFKMTCPECGIKLPPYTDEGKHNFCPKSTGDGRIINVCMKCKMEEVVEKWRRDKTY